MLPPSQAYFHLIIHSQSNFILFAHENCFISSEFSSKEIWIRGFSLSICWRNVNDVIFFLSLKCMKSRNTCQLKLFSSKMLNFKELSWYCIGKCTSICQILDMNASTDFKVHIVKPPQNWWKFRNLMWKSRTCADYYLFAVTKSCTACSTFEGGGVISEQWVLPINISCIQIAH